LSKLHKNLIYNFIGQFYLSILAIVMAPVYVKYLGLESYGLIGFFAVMQSWMQLFDLGFSATLTRQSAQYAHGGLCAKEYLTYFKSVQVLFSIIGFVLLIISFIVGYYYSDHWIKAQHLSSVAIRTSTILILMIGIIRWQQGFYRGIINGFEHQTWLNKFNIIFSTIKYIGVLGVIHFIRADIGDFFYYQGMVVLIEFVILYSYVYKILPATKEKIVCKFAYIQKNITFSLSIAFTSSVWVLVTQLDKLILSKYLLMKDYACFTLAVAVASGISVVTSPISVAILPRFSGLVAKGDIDSFVELYRKVTRFIVVLITPITILFILQGHKILFAWTNNLEIATQAKGILSAYAFGNTILAIIAMAYYLQFAYGKLRLHLFGNLISIFLMVPMLIYFTTHYGAVGASYVWVFSNLFYLIIWVPIVHKTYLEFPHYQWLRKDVIQVFIISGFISWILMKYLMVSTDRFLIALQSTLVVSISVFFSGLIHFSELRKMLLNSWYGFFQEDLEHG
jgi:O-antigen/teichoic acid export membrane protein